MRLNWKFLGLAGCAGALLLSSGCSGINTTHSVSPATFLLPGLMKADPQPTEGAEPTLPAATGPRVAQLTR